MGNKNEFSPPATGGSSLLVIFAVLCLTVFALLGLSTVQADKRLSEASAAAVTGYYAADTEAETLLARIRAGEVPPGVLEEGDGVYSYSCMASDTQMLEVSVRVDADGSWQILRWQLVSTAVWEADTGLNVWLP